MLTVSSSELTCFLVRYFKRLDKAMITHIIGKFYHEDELYTAKVELNKHVFMPVDVSTPMPIDGWAKMINKKELRSFRKLAMLCRDIWQRRRMLSTCSCYWT